ncbi:hypothetical protein ACFHWD_04355 [Clostridium sp. MT-14]|uniref:hypothetical protein n=1 Tax=Clostridium sp. MT-14 TaxID=3348360 RepID=UPI0035F4FCB8
MRNNNIKNWNITRKGINRFFKLKNEQWLKIQFIYCSSQNVWLMIICVANSKRQCNDCMKKTENSPKILFGKCTGNKAGLEPFIISLKSLLEFEKTISNCEIRILGANSRLRNIYKRLTRYGYQIRKYKDFGEDKECVYKNV